MACAASHLTRTPAPLPISARAGPQSSTPGGHARTVVRAEPDCVKTRLFLVPWGTFVEKRLEPGRVPYYPLILDTKWDAYPFSFPSLDFSHSLEPRATVAVSVESEVLCSTHFIITM